MLEDTIPLNLSPVSSDLRRHPRAYVSISVTLEIGDSIVRGAECRNISMGGMFISIPVPIPAGTSGIVTLTQRCGDNRYSFSASFSVVRVETEAPRGPGIGVYFKQIGREDLKNLAAIVEFHLSISIKEKLRIAPERIEGFVFKIADTKEELEQAFRIVHDSYVREGYMDPHPSGMRLSIFNALPNSTTFIGVLKGNVILATTLFPDSFLGLPMDSLYEQELRGLREDGKFLGEVGAFAVSPDFRDSNPTIPLHVQKLIYHYSIEYLKLDCLVLTINPKHRLYYQHLVLCNQIGVEKQYGLVKDNPAIAMVNELQNFPERLKEQYGDMIPEKNLHEFFCSPPCSSILLPDENRSATVWNADLLDYFFEVRTDTFSRTDKKTVNLIRSLYK